MSNIVFINLSSNQIDSPNLYSDLKLDSNKVLELNEQLIESVIDNINKLASNDVEFVLIPGGLFDVDNARLSTIDKFIDCLNNHSQIKFFIAPKYSKNYKFSIAFDNDIRKVMNFALWGDNCKIFKNNDYSYYSIGTNLHVHGASFCPNFEPTINYDLPKGINIALFSKFDNIAQQYQSDLSIEKFTTKEFHVIATDEYIEEDYIDNSSFILSSSFKTNITYKCFNEKSKISKITIENNGADVKANIDFIENNWKKLLYSNIDVTSLDFEGIVLELESLLSDYEFNNDNDLICLELVGTYDYFNTELSVRISDYLKKYKYLCLINNSKPDYLILNFDENQKLKNYFENLRNLRKVSPEELMKYFDSEIISTFKNLDISIDTVKIIEEAMIMGLDHINNVDRRGRYSD